MQPLSNKHRIVLIVEDNPDDARIVRRALENFGVNKLFFADTAEDAMAFLAKKRCDVMLIDYNLPGMNGLRLLERTRESWPQIRVIFVTGAQDDKVAASAIKLGAVDYVSKDDLLTAGVVRSLQACFQGRTGGGEKEQTARSPTLEAACAEGEWLLESLSGGEPFAPSHAEGALVPEYGSERWSDALVSLTRYLVACSEPQSVEPLGEEAAMVRMFVDQGLSPRDILMLYLATLRGLRTDAVELRWSPAASLARLLARLVEAYQRQASYAAIDRESA